MIKVKNVGTILDIQHFAEDILLINKTLHFLYCESSQWGNPVLQYFRQVHMGQENNLIFYKMGWFFWIVI